MGSGLLRELATLRGYIKTVVFHGVFAGLTISRNRFWDEKRDSILAAR